MNVIFTPKFMAVLTAWIILLVAVAIALTGIFDSPIPLFAVLPEIWLTAIVIGTPLGLRARRQAKEAIAAGRDPFVEMGLSQARVWGFKADPAAVGGGFYSRVELEEAEVSVTSVLGAYSTNRWLGGQGYITLTDRRLIFTGSRLPSLLRVGRAEVPYSDILSCETRRVLSLAGWVGSLSQAVVLTTSRKTHYLWPAVMRRDLFAQQLLELKQKADKD